MINNYKMLIQNYVSKFNKNKIALITGSSKGIGLSIAKLLDSYGVKVLLNSRKKIKKSLTSGFKITPIIFVLM